MQKETVSEIPNKLISLASSEGRRGNGKESNTTYSYKRQEVVESRVRPHLEEKRHIRDYEQDNFK